jgi:hypothetical protein
MGLWLGATFGGAVTVIGGFGSLLATGAVVGAAVGALCGAAVGLANGLVLAWLATTQLFAATARHPARTATAVAVLTTVATGLAVPLTLFASSPSVGLRAAFVYVPVTIAALAAAALSRRLPPGH